MHRKSWGHREDVGCQKESEEEGPGLSLAFGTKGFPVTPAPHGPGFCWFSWFWPGK